MSNHAKENSQEKYDENMIEVIMKTAIPWQLCTSKILLTRLLRMDLNTAFPEQRIAGLRPANPERLISSLRPAFPEQRRPPSAA